jgi:hypothetical protein
MTGWLLIVVAGRGHWAAALLLPMYYIADATITLFKRWRRGERLSESHRTHYYQLAIQRGFSSPDVTRRVFALNVLLVSLALATVYFQDGWIDVCGLCIGCSATLALLYQFENGREIKAGSAPKLLTYQALAKAPSRAGSRSG